MTPNEFVKLYMQNCQYENELSLMAAAIACVMAAGDSEKIDNKK
jgi:hypothetical protein